MARPRLRSPDQSLPTRIILGVYEFAASLQLAVVLIFSLAAVLAWATFVESEYGQSVVQFGLYQSWWFGVLGALLAINIFCAAVIRYPWKRHQTGFVITHIGLLTLMFGCLLTRRGGIDAQMTIVEGMTNNRAYSDEERIELAIERPAADTSQKDEQVEVISIPFRGGPFNWADLDKLRRWPTRESVSVRGEVSKSKLLLAIPNMIAWNLADVDRGLVYDRDGIRIEALDYYSSAREIDVPSLELAMTSPRRAEMDEETGREKQGPEQWTPISLAVSPRSSLRAEGYPFGVGAREQVGGGSITFTLLGDQTALDAFLNSKPDQELGFGEKGQVVLFAGGKRTAFRVEDKIGQGAFSLEGADLTAEVTAYYQRPVPKTETPGKIEFVESKNEQQPASPIVDMTIRRGDKEQERLLLFANDPELDMQAYQLGAFGSYWVNAGEKSSAQLLAGQGGSRIDIVQGPDEKLYYRYWNRREVAALAELPTDGTAVDAFKMPIAQLKMKVDKFYPGKQPGKDILPVAFNSKGKGAARAVKLKATVDGKTEEFWLIGNASGAISANERRRFAGNNRDVTVSFPPRSFDVGYQIRLDNFERRLDPGTSQPSHYSSTVDFLNDETGQEELKDVFITMNAPVDFSDPRNGRSYRLFQESFAPIPGDDRFQSVLTVNYDPGRGVKYVGCLLIVAGIVTMFYMRAYFFTPKKTPTLKPAKRELAPA